MDKISKKEKIMWILILSVIIFFVLLGILKEGLGILIVIFVTPGVWMATLIEKIFNPQGEAYFLIGVLFGTSILFWILFLYALLKIMRDIKQIWLRIGLLGLFLGIGLSSGTGIMLSYFGISFVRDDFLYLPIISIILFEIISFIIVFISEIYEKRGDGE